MSKRKNGVRTAALTLALCAGAAAPMTGCDTARTIVAKAIGAPTPQDFAQAEVEIKAAEDKLRVVDAQLGESEREIASLAAARERYAVTKATIHEQIAGVGQMLAGAVGDRADLLMTQLKALQRQAEQIDAQDATAAQLESQFAAHLADITAHRMDISHAVETARLTLDELLAKRDGAIESAAGAARAAGRAAQALGAPAGEHVGDAAGDWMSEGLALILGGGAAGGAGYVATRRRKREAEEAKALADSERKWADAATREATAAKEVIRTTEEFGLLKDVDTGAKAAASKALTSAARDLLNQVTASVVKASRGPVAKEVAPAS